MFYIHFNDGFFTGYKYKSLDKAINACNQINIPANVNLLNGKAFNQVYCNLAISENIYLNRTNDVNF